MDDRKGRPSTQKIGASFRATASSLLALSTIVALCACCGVSSAADTIARPSRARQLAAPLQSPPSTDQHRLYGDLLPLVLEPSGAKASNSLEGQLLQLGAMRLTVESLQPQHGASPNAQRRSRAFDASEGTPLDPLNNTTFDLNYSHDIPPMK
jgi:hypothetical protein